MITFSIILASLLVINTLLFLFSRNKEDDQAKEKADVESAELKPDYKTAS